MYKPPKWACPELVEGGGWGGKKREMPQAACRFLDLPQKRFRDFENQILIESVDADDNAVVAADFHKLAGESYESAIYYFDIVAGGKFFESDFDLCIAVNQ